MSGELAQIDRFAWRATFTPLWVPPRSLVQEQGIYVHTFLSNFYRCRIKFQGMVFPSVENAYQASKSKFPDAREPFRDCTPGEAKAMGRKLQLRSDWEEIKLAVMGLLVLEKFVIHEELAEALLETGEANLIEGNTWGDRYWGCVRGENSIGHAPGPWVGENQLGKTLMGVRELLRRLHA